MRIFISLRIVLVGIVAWLCSTQAQTTGTLIDRMYDNGLTIYQTPETFRLDQYVTRGEIAKFLNQYAATLDLTKNIPLSNCQFEDIDNYDLTLIPHIIEACEYGLVKWFEGQYFPNRLITQAEALTVVIRSILGIQDESWNPWRTATHQKAQNLQIIPPTDSNKLDTPALRWMIWKRLYIVSTSYMPIAQWKQKNDIYSSLVTSWWITITYIDGTQSFTPTAVENEYTQWFISPNARYVALTTTWSTPPVVTFYDARSNQIQWTVQGSFVRRSETWLARIETCYPSLWLCETRTSISSETPRIVPEVRAESSAIWFVCQRNFSWWLSQLAFNNSWVLKPLETAERCAWIQPSMYTTYAIPEQALLWAMTTTNQKRTYWYSIKNWRNYDIYRSQEYDSKVTSWFVYMLVDK